MSTTPFFVNCKVCGGEVDSFAQHIQFILIPDEAVQEHETIEMKCGCTIDFPEWRIDPETGTCRIYNFADILYLEFHDKEVMFVEDDE